MSIIAPKKIINVFTFISINNQILMNIITFFFYLFYLYNKPINIINFIIKFSFYNIFIKKNNIKIYFFIILFFIINPLLIIHRFFKI